LQRAKKKYGPFGEVCGADGLDGLLDGANTVRWSLRFSKFVQNAVARFKQILQ